MLLNVMMLSLHLGIQFMGTQYPISQRTYSICRQFISALFISISLLKLNPLSNDKYKLFLHSPTTQQNHFPFPELFLVLSFSLFLYVEYTISFVEPPPCHNLLEMNTIKDMLHIKRQSSAISAKAQSTFEKDKIHNIIVILKAIYSGILIASLSNLELLMLGLTFVAINVLRLEDESKIDKIVQLSSAAGGFFIGSILLSYGMSFVCISLVAGYLIYYSTVLITNQDYRMDSDFKSQKFITFITMCVLTSLVYLI